MSLEILIKQLFEQQSSTFTYLLISPQSGELAIIDPVVETFERDCKIIEELGGNLKYILETHVHADHVTSSSLLRSKFGAQIALSAKAQVKLADIQIEDGDQLKLGDSIIEAIQTPGHTDGCISFYMKPYVFTGDTLLIRACGRTDFQQGSPKTLFHSVREKLFNLPDETIIYPGHNYQGVHSSSIWEEKKYNPRLNLDINEEQFNEIMNNLNLAYPKKIDIAVPRNLNLGKES